jgi:hypothetical protein
VTISFSNNILHHGVSKLSHAKNPTPIWRSTPCLLSATAYSIHSQLPSVSGFLPSIRNLRTRHAVVARDPPNMVSHITTFIHTWTSPEWKTHTQIDHALVDKRRYTDTDDVPSFGGADYNMDHYMAVAKARQRQSVNKRGQNLRSINLV